MLRIISGKLRGRKLSVLKSPELRPTSDRVREAIFSTLASVCQVQDALVLDLYAGTGAFGIETLSRGASQVVFVEKSKKLCQCLVENLEKFEVSESSFVYQGDVLLVLKEPRMLRLPGSEKFDIVFADPPYPEHPGEELLFGLLEAKFLRENGLVVVESGADLSLPERVVSRGEGGYLELVKSRTYGDTQVCYYEKFAG